MRCGVEARLLPLSNVGTVGTVRLHAVVRSRRPPGRKPSRLGIVDAVHEAHQLAHRRCGGTTAGGTYARRPSSAAGRSRNRSSRRPAAAEGEVQHGEDRRVGMIEAHGVDDHEFREVVPTAHVVAVPGGDDVEGGECLSSDSSQNRRGTGDQLAAAALDPRTRQPAGKSRFCARPARRSGQLGQAGNARRSFRTRSRAPDPLTPTLNSMPRGTTAISPGRTSRFPSSGVEARSLRLPRRGIISPSALAKYRPSSDGSRSNTCTACRTARRFADPSERKETSTKSVGLAGSGCGPSAAGSAASRPRRAAARRATQPLAMRLYCGCIGARTQPVGPGAQVLGARRGERAARTGLSA